MKLERILQTALLAVAGMGIPAVAVGQVYQVTDNITGYMDGTIADLGYNYGNPFPEAHASLAFGGAFSETVYFDSINLTVRQVLSLPSAAPVTAKLTTTQNIGGHDVSGTTTITESIASPGIVLDTGPQPIIWAPAQGGYVYNQAAGGNADFSGPIHVTGTYSLDTGGQTYAGNFNYTTSLAPSSPSAHLSTFFSQSADKSTLTMTGMSDNGMNLKGQGQFVNLSAGNGFTIGLAAGGYDDHLDYFGLGPGTVNAQLAPEPGSLALLGGGLVGLVCWRRRRRR